MSVQKSVPARLAHRAIYRGVRRALGLGGVTVFAAAAVFASAQAAESDEILLNSRTLDTSTAEADVLRGQAPSGGKRLRLVQFDGPVLASEYEALRGTGAMVVDYIPNNAYLVYGDAAALTKVRALAQAEVLQWEGDYAADLKINNAARVLDAKGVAPDFYTIQLVVDPQANADTLALIAAATNGRRLSHYTFRHYVNIEADLSAAELAQIAARPDVISLMPDFTPVLFDERATQIMANQITGTPAVPIAGDYVAWLGARGFTQAQFDASAFTIDISD